MESYSKSPRPRKTSTNANKVRQVFGNMSRKALPIPQVINDYNNYMGGVDLADQLRGYYNCQLTARRTWFPLFFWLLDTVLVNSIILYRKVTNTKIASKDFRIALVWDLIQEAIDNESSSNRITRGQLKQKKASLKSPLKNKRIAHVTKNFNLPINRLSPGNHLVEWRRKRESCLYCRYLKKKNDQGKKKKKNCAISQTQFWCIKCNVPLCCSIVRPNCFKDFHSKQ